MQNYKQISFWLVLYLASSTLLAQTRIPDQNFAVAIHNACNSCIDPGTNTLLLPAATLTSLNVSNKKIADLTGIEGFTNLQTLKCDSNSLVTLPALPSGLTVLYCRNNKLTSLPTLPNSLKDLYCYQNQLTSLPNLPNSLLYLHCYQNQLTSLPTLPNSLISLICGFNQLTSLPSLPSNLGGLDCSANQLTSLPQLPSSLGGLLCGFNQLTSLPNLPNSLNYLYCFQNQLTSLPSLPSSLQELQCPYNQLFCLPILPSSLRKIYFDTNKINCFPNAVNGLETRNAGTNVITAPPICTNPTATLSGNQTVNAGQTANLSVTLTGTGPWAITLSDGKTYNATASPYIITVTPTATTTYTLTSVKTNCNAGTVSGQAVVTVNQCANSPTIGITTGGKFVVCAGSTLKLSSTGGASGYTYQWKKDNVNFGGNTADIDVTEAGQYVVTATDSKGCAGNSGTVNIIKSSPTATLTGKNTFCTGTTTTLTATFQNTVGTGTVQYQWKQDGKNVGDGKSTWVASQSGSYAVEITDANGCKATSTAMTIIEKGSDIVSIVKPDGPITVYAPNTAVLSATLGYEKDPRFKYQWLKDGKEIVGATSYVYQATSSGSYAATISDADCAVTSTTVQVTVLVPTSIPLNATDELRIYPNPTDGLLYVSVKLQKKANLALKLLNITGQPIQELGTWDESHFEQKIDVSSFSSGTYLLEVEGKDFVKRVKILKK